MAADFADLECEASAKSCYSARAWSGVPVYCNRLAVQGWLWGLKRCMGGKSLVRWNEGEKSKETKEKKGGTERAFSCGRSIL